MSDKRPGKFKSAILNWLGVPTSLADSAFWNWWAGEQNAAGQRVNEKTVLTLSAAWACSRLISESVATLPLHLYERTPNGRRVATEHPLYRVLHSTPNWASTATTFWESAVAAMLLRGNAFVEMKRVGGRLVSLHFLDPSRLQGSTDGNGVLHVRYTDPGGVQREIPNTDLWHLPGFSLDGVWGLSTIQYGASVFGNALASGVAANDMFEQGLAPKIAFTMNAVLKKEQRQDFRQNFENITGAINAGKPAVLEGGMDAKVLAIPPRDAQLLESRGFSVEEVCRWFRVDPSLVGHGGKDSNWGTGLEQKFLAFLTLTLRPWLTRIEQGINKRLLSPQDQQRYYAEYSIEGLLRADSAARSAFYSVMVNNGIMTRDEVRAKENLPQLGGNADVLTVQSAMTPLDSIGQETPGQAARAAITAWLKDQEGEHEH